MHNVNQLRSLFLDYFKRQGHQIVHSSSLVPKNDPTLMFTNSGMVQFKDVFTGKEKRDYTRASTSQKCVRAGGKHNDLDNVGHTARHHTFFEMLGNFSFGDYFKEDAIRFAWEMVTKEIGLNKDRLYVTVYHEDDEALKLWKNIAGLSEDRIIKISTSDNFWSMGDTGPCGPCSEIFYDHGDHIFGGLPGTKDQDGDRYIEIWNLVFMQYEQFADGSRVNLPMQCIDTGMGLERISAVVQGVHDNYDIDLFKAIIDNCSHIVKTPANGKALTSYRIIADHLRSAAFLIADGVIPSNEGRGYVLRRIMRRAIRQSHMLGYNQPLLHQLIPNLISLMGEAYPELIRASDFVTQIIFQEEQNFLATLGKGLKLLESELQNMNGQVFSGETAFKLHDTYGFPLDLTTDILNDKNIKIDNAQFEICMQNQKEMARKAWAGSGGKATDTLWFDIKAEHGITEFLGYDAYQAQADILALVVDNKPVEQIQQIGQKFYLIVNQTPFYGESGGQLGDIGFASSDHATIKITDTKKPLPGLHIHECVLERGIVKIHDNVQMIIDQQYRNQLRANHTATHLLHAVLHQKIGKHVTQQGSHVASDRLRFDVSYNGAISSEMIREIEIEVNRLIIEDHQVKTTIMNYEDAVNAGAMALFGEKYDDQVRVVCVEGDVSTELCGGTHVASLGQIGLFKIISESSIAAGIRRIEAITGLAAVSYVQNVEQQLDQITEMLKSSRSDAQKQLEQLIESKRKLEKEIAAIKSNNLASLLKFNEQELISYGQVTFAEKELKDADIKDVRGIVQNYTQHNKQAIVAVYNIAGDKISFLVSAGEEARKICSALDLANVIAGEFGARAGGKEDLAQGGSSAVNKLADARHAVSKFLASKCQS